MNRSIKLVMTTALLFVASNHVYAKPPMQDGEGSHQRPSFSSVDLNSDGEIDFDEFSEQTLPHGDHETVFDSMDTDGSGYVSEDEFENHKPPRDNKGRGERDD